MIPIPGTEVQQYGSTAVPGTRGSRVRDKGLLFPYAECRSHAHQEISTAHTALRSQVFYLVPDIYECMAVGMQEPRDGYAEPEPEPEPDRSRQESPREL